MAKGQTLVGLVMIAEYVGRGRKTIRKRIRDENFPALMVDGRWESNTVLIDEYEQRRIAQACRGEEGDAHG